jgi:hypothetical protein
MKLKKSETNNAIITTLANVREHPNADRLKLATVLGTQVIVDLEAEDGDVVVYFDSNLRLSHDYLFWNNLYSNPEMNSNPKIKPGFFGKNGRVKTQRFRGEVSNGLVMYVNTLVNIPEVAGGLFEFNVGDEFTHINDVEICGKYFVEKSSGVHIGSKKKKKPRVFTNMFWKMWDTKHLMRETDRIVPGTLYVEEKIHGTSGRTARALFYRRRWFQFWKPKITSFWKVVSGTRRVDGIKGHMKEERRDIHERLAPHVRKGEELYYEIYGYSYGGKGIQTGYPYGCEKYHRRAWDDPNEKTPPLPYKVMLYRVTITTEDGYRIDFDREQVYRRAEELGLEKPHLLRKHQYLDENIIGVYLDTIMNDAIGNSALDPNTIREGIVVWFKDRSGCWTCLKHKSEEFLMLESKNKDKGIGDVEDIL